MTPVARRRWRRLRTFVLAALVAAGMLVMATGAASADAWPLTPPAHAGG
jgi:hypothetical protein